MTNLQRLTSLMFSSVAPGRKALMLSGITLAVGLSMSCSGGGVCVTEFEEKAATLGVVMGSLGNESMNSRRCSKCMISPLFLVIRHSCLWVEYKELSLQV